MSNQNDNQKAKPFRNPLCVALDVDSAEQAYELVDQLHDIVGGFKLGPRLCLRYGQDIVQNIAKRSPVFVDNKHFDIPSTMEAAVRASFASGASLVTVHALSGLEALIKMAELENELSQIRPFRILAVTILTSWSQSSLSENFQKFEIPQHVQLLANLVKDSGLSSIVCSPHELELFANENFYKVTPGIRFDLDERGDQKRVLGPREALASGSNLLVVGRPIIAAKNPREIATDYVQAIGVRKY